jgi:hypothetical protein
LCRTDEGNAMNAETFREYSTRLNLAYGRYVDTLRAAFFPTAPRAVRTRAAPAEQRWESEGGKPK